MKLREKVRWKWTTRRRVVCLLLYIINREKWFKLKWGLEMKNPIQIRNERFKVHEMQVQT